MSKEIEELRRIADDSFDSASSVIRGLVTNVILTPRFQWIQHPLGFYQASVLVDSPVNLRLHYWPRDRRPDASAITPFHDHVWSLDSYVIIGRIDNVIVSLIEDESGPFVVANIRQVNGVDSVVPSPRRVAISSEEATRYISGEHYVILPGIFHRSKVDISAATLTLVRAEVVKQGGPRTLVPAGYAGQAPRRAYLNEHECYAISVEVSELLR